MATTWNPLAALLSVTDSKPFALMILNQPLESQKSYLKTLWDKAVFKSVVDGATNELYNCFPDRREKYIPDVISGDLDSAKQEYIDWYENLGVEIVCTQDQDENDFLKALRVLESRTSEEIASVFVLGAFGGRLDQIFANINALFGAAKFSGKQIILMSEGSMACLLQPGDHTIYVDTGLEGDWCGLIPIDGACSHVTTTGLKYNLDDSELRFGHLISTSNSIDGSAVVTVTTDKPILWTMGFETMKNISC